MYSRFGVETSEASAQAQQEFERIIAERALPTVFQPVVDLRSGQTVGYEAFVRPPQGSVITSAQALLDTAYRMGRVVEFDWMARASACRAVTRAALPPDQLLFLNIEPIAMSSACPPDLWPDIERVFTRFPVILEVTERSLGRNPRLLLNGIDRQRPFVAGFAVDDVGSSAMTLSLLPLISPHVIKLDLRIVQSGLTTEVTEVLDVAYEEAERTAALILAEGIETQSHLELARSLGVHLGQGYLFGRPADLAHQPSPSATSVRVPQHTTLSVSRPFDAIGGRATSRAGIDVLRALMEQVQTSSGDLHGPCVLMCHLPRSDLLTEAHYARLAALVRRGVFTAVFGPGIPADPGLDIRGVDESQADLHGQWAIIALGPSVAVALLAQAATEEQTSYDFTLTHDRERVIAAAHSLFRRIGAPA